MRVGINLQCEHPPARFLQQVRLIDQAGFDELWVADSTLTFRHLLVYLTLAAEHTRRVKIGSAVAHPHIRHPADSLAALAAIDELSGGRAMLGFGAGDRYVHFAGLPVAKVGEIREAVQLMRRLLRADTAVTLDGTHWRLLDAELPFRLRKDLPIYLAASNPRMLALAGEVADGVIAFVGADVRTGGWARSVAGSVDFGLAFPCSLDEDAGRAQEDAAGMAAYFARLAPHLLARIGSDDPIRNLALACTPAEAVDRLLALRDAGFEHVVLLPRGRLRDQTLELLAERVLPQLL